MQLLSIDVGKRSFHIHGITSDGEIISRKISRFLTVTSMNQKSSFK